jgi:hypothetical protein
MQSARAFRRCHMCGHICEALKPLRRCTSCDKAFAPFYYFNDQYTPVQAEGGLRAPDMEGQWRPLQGLTAYWQSD